jgi:hypothetical protein
MAIAALMALTVDDDRWHPIVNALIALLHLACITYCAWYVWRGPEPIERRKVRR